MLRFVTALTVAACLCAPALAQVQRAFPQNALRGAIVIGVAPEIQLNGAPARLAPGARIRDANNMAVVPSGLIMDVWVLNPAELANKTWPTTPAEAATWQFNPGNQTWIKP